jgi:anti-anti-sigma regulatory factor
VKALIEGATQGIVLDIEEVTLVDADAVNLLAAYELNGAEISH